MHTKGQSPISGMPIKQTVADFDIIFVKSKLQEDATTMDHTFPVDSKLEAHATYQNVKQALVSSGMALEEPFRTFYCPLSGKIMKDPVMTSCNSIYDRDEITKQFQQASLMGHMLEDPFTKQMLFDDSLTPVLCLQQTISEWRERNSLACIIMAKETLSDDAQRLEVLEKLLSICQEMPRAKDWIAFEGLLSQIVKCLKTRSVDVKKRTFMLLRLLIADHDKNKEAASVGECIELATGNLLRAPPLLEAAEFLEEMAKSGYGCTQIAQEQRALVALVTCVTTVKDAAVKQIVESILMLLSETDETVIQMAQANWCSPLLRRLDRGSEETKLAMVGFLAEMKLNKESVEYFVQNGVISALLIMVQSQKEDLKNSAIRALQNFSSQDMALRCMAQEGLVTVILEIFSSKAPLSLKLGAASILENLTLKCGVNYLLQTCGQTALPQLLVCDLFYLLGDLTLRVSSTSVHIHLLKTLCEMARSPDALQFGHLIRDEEGCLEVICTLLKPKVAEVCVLALDLLSTLCDGKEGVTMVSLLTEDVKLLMDLLEDDSESVEIHIAVARVLAKLPHSEAKPVSLIAVSTLVKLSSFPNVEWQAQAVGALLLYMHESTVQQFLAERDFIFYLVQKLSSASSLLKSRAAMALKAFSLTSSKIISGPKKQTLAFYNSWKMCPVHNGRCKVKTTFCIVKAGAVPNLVAMLEDSSSEAVEAALDALSTLLQPQTMNVNGSGLLHDLGVVDKVLHLAMGKSIICSDKCLDLLGKFFLVPEIKNKYLLEARTVLLSLAGCQQSQRICQKAVCMFSELC